jgi:hypothetical protein
LYDNTCGFWVVIFALFIILGIPLNHLPSQATEVKTILSLLWKEYQTSNDGGLTRQLVLSLFDPMDRNIRTRLANGRRDLVSYLNHFINETKHKNFFQWAPRRPDLNIASKVYHGKFNTFIDEQH